MRKRVTTTLFLAGVAMLSAACPGDQQPAITDDPFLTEPGPPPPTQPAPPPMMPADTLPADTPTVPGAAPGAP